MNEVTVEMAVISLRPGAQWSMTNDDVENITWHTEGVEPLTQAEVDAEVARLEQEEVDKQAAKEAAIKFHRTTDRKFSEKNQKVTNPPNFRKQQQSFQPNLVKP